MPKLFLPYQAERRWLNYMVGAPSVTGLKAAIESGYIRVGLFKSDVVPALDDEISDYLTIEATYSGYAREQIEVFAAASTNGSGQTIAVCPAVTFIHSGGGVSNSIYGYFLVDTQDTGAGGETDDGTLMGVHRFPDANRPKTMSISSHFITITPRIQLRTITPTDP